MQKYSIYVLRISNDFYKVGREETLSTTVEFSCPNKPKFTYPHCPTAEKREQPVGVVIRAMTSRPTSSLSLGHSHGHSHS